MQRSNHPRSTPRAVPQVAQELSVVLCCARADAPHLRPLVAHLEHEGITTQLLEGIDSDLQLLGAALDREPGACVFVACLSDTFGPKDFRRLTGVYNARKGPSHYLADVVVEPDEILVMAETIETALTRASKAISSPDRDKRANGRGPSRLRDVVGVTKFSAVAETAPQSSRKPKPAEEPREPLREQSVAGAYLISARTGVTSSASEPKTASTSIGHGAGSPEQSSVAPTLEPASSGWKPAVLILILILIAVASTAVLLVL